MMRKGIAIACALIVVCLCVETEAIKHLLKIRGKAKVNENDHDTGLQSTKRETLCNIIGHNPRETLCNIGYNSNSNPNPIVIREENTTQEVQEQSESFNVTFPFSLCPGAPTDLSFQSLTLVPDPPVKGANIEIGLVGTVDETLESGSNFEVAVTFMGVKIFDEQVDLAKATTLPTGPGSVTMNYSVAIPSIAPSGKYGVQLTFNDQTQTEITCVGITLNL